MRGYYVDLRCPHCDGECQHLASGLPIAGTETRAIAKCRGCRKEWIVEAFLRPSPTLMAMRRAAHRAGVRVMT